MPKPSPKKEDSGKFKSAEFVDTDDSSSEDEKTKKQLKRNKKKVRKSSFIAVVDCLAGLKGYSPICIRIRAFFQSFRHPQNLPRARNPKKRKVSPKKRSLKMNLCLNDFLYVGINVLIPFSILNLTVSFVTN